MRKMPFKSLPPEILLHISKKLGTADLNSLTRTCIFMSSLLDSLLYQQAVTNGEYQSKSKFLYTVIYGQTKAVSMFLKAGVLMSAFDDYIEMAARIRELSSRISEEKRLASQEKSFHPLLAAAAFGNIDVVKVLLDKGRANIDFQNYSGYTALHYAVDADHPDIIKLLLERGANIGDTNTEAQSPFVYAAKCGNRNAVELMFNKLQLQLELRRSNVIFDEHLKRLCEKACFEPCRKGYFDIIHFFLHRGFDVNSFVDSFVGQEPKKLLHMATTFRHASIIELIVKHGARMECERDCGAVSMLSRGGSWNKQYIGTDHLDILMYLLRSGFNVANGGIHACALWALVKYSGKQGGKQHPRWHYVATTRQRKALMSLLREKGFEQRKCRHGCFKMVGDASLLLKMREPGMIEEYVAEQELRK